MPRTIVVVDGTSVQATAVIEKFLNANLAAKGSTTAHQVINSSSTARPTVNTSRSNTHASHGEAFCKVDDIDFATASPHPQPYPRRPSLPSFSSESAVSISSRAADDSTDASIARPTSYPEAGVHPQQSATTSLAEEQLVVAAADATTATLGPLVFSHMPGYFASSSSLQELPSSVSILGPLDQTASPVTMSQVDMPPVTGTIEHTHVRLASSTRAHTADAAFTMQTIAISTASAPKLSQATDFHQQWPNALHETQGIKVTSAELEPIHTQSKLSNLTELNLKSGRPGTGAESRRPHSRSQNPGGKQGFLWKLRSLHEGQPIEVEAQHASKSKSGRLSASFESRIVNYGNAQSLRDAMTGIYGLFFGLDAFTSSPQLFVEDHIRNIIHSAVLCGVQHVIFAGHLASTNVDGFSVFNEERGASTAAGAPVGDASGEGVEDDLAGLPLAVQRCTMIYRSLCKLAASGLFRLTAFVLPVCFEASLLCEHAWFNLRPKTNTFVLDIPVPSTTVMPLCTAADVGCAALQVFSRPDRFDGVVVDLTSDIASPRELCAQLTQIIYVGGKRVIHSDDYSNWLSAQIEAATGGDPESQAVLLDPKTNAALLLREFILFMASFTSKPLTLLLPQVQTNQARTYNLRLTPWREFVMGFCDELLVPCR